MARAVHVRDQENNHAVAVGAIRVLVCEKAGEWFAQGIEIDYAASGTTLKDVQHRFEKGLASTLDLHLRRFQTPEKLLRFAPRKAWEHLKAKSEYDLTMITKHDLSDAFQAIPFGQIAYLRDNSIPDEVTG